jgi:hypothetical protein
VSRAGKLAEPAAWIVRANPMIILGLDIDDTITRDPVFFKQLTDSVTNNGGKVYIVSSRVANPEVRVKTRAELRDYGIHFEELHLLPSVETARKTCPHKALDWYSMYLWQKVDYCLQRKVTHYFDDDQKVIPLFRKYAPEIFFFHFPVEK